MSKFKASMFGALRAAERVVVDGLLVRTFQLEGSEGGAGILNLEDGSAISFANQELTIINGYSAFRTEAEAPHSVDFIMPGNRGLSEVDIQAWSQTRAQTQAAVDATRLQPAFRLR